MRLFALSLLLPALLSSRYSRCAALWLVCIDIPPPSVARPPAAPIRLLHGIYLGFGKERHFPEQAVRDALEAAAVNVTFWVRTADSGYAKRTARALDTTPLR